jgi:hypothetical protein
LLWDFSRGSVAFRNDEAGRSIQPGRQGEPSGASTARTALVCPNELDHGLFRILHVFSALQSYPRELRVFRRKKPAWRWLEVCRWCRRALQPLDCTCKGCCIPWSRQPGRRPR